MVDAFKKKDKKVVKDNNGDPIVRSQTIKLLPKKSKEGADLADLCPGMNAQALMGFEQEARGELLKSGFSHMSKLIASGNYTFDVARVNLANGKFMLQIKPSMGKAAILTPEELEKQAKSLGYQLVKAPEAESQAPATDGETEVVTTKQGKKKAAAAKAVGKPAIVAAATA